MHDFVFDDWYPVVQRIASVRASGVVRLLGLPREDVRDLVQEALRELLEKGHAYDPARGRPSTFAERIVRNGLVSLIRHQNARCRRRAAEVDIDDFKDRLAEPDRHVGLRIDVWRVLEGVTAFDRAVAISLCGYSAAETASRLGVGRATIYRAFARLRTAFLSAGIGPPSENMGAKRGRDR